MQNFYELFQCIYRARSSATQPVVIYGIDSIICDCRQHIVFLPFRKDAHMFFLLGFARDNDIGILED